MELLTIYKAYFSGLYKGIYRYTPNIWLYMVQHLLFLGSWHSHWNMAIPLWIAQGWYLFCPLFGIVFPMGFLRCIESTTWYLNDTHKKHIVQLWPEILIFQMVIKSGYFYGIIGLHINHVHGIWQIWGYFSDKHHYYGNVASFPVSSISPSGQDFERLSVTIGVPWELHSHTHHTHRWWIPIMALCLTVWSTWLAIKLYIYIYTMWGPPVISWFISTSN